MRSDRLANENSVDLGKLPTTACWYCSQKGRPVKLLLAQKRQLRPMYAGNHQDGVEKASANQIEEQDAEHVPADGIKEPEAVEESAGVR